MIQEQRVLLPRANKKIWNQRWANTLTYWSARRQRQYFRPMIESTKIAIFRKNFRKDLNQNIDQSPDIRSKPSNYRNFSQKKKDLNINIEFLRHLRNECRNSVGGRERRRCRTCWEPWRSRSVGLTVHLAPGISRPLPQPPPPHPRAMLNSRIRTDGQIRPWNRFLDSINV